MQAMGIGRRLSKGDRTTTGRDTNAGAHGWVSISRR